MTDNQSAGDPARELQNILDSIESVSKPYVARLRVAKQFGLLVSVIMFLLVWRVLDFHWYVAAICALCVCVPLALFMAEKLCGLWRDAKISVLVEALQVGFPEGSAKRTSALETVAERFEAAAARFCAQGAAAPDTRTLWRVDYEFMTCPENMLLTKLDERKALPPSVAARRKAALDALAAQPRIRAEGVAAREKAALDALGEHEDMTSEPKTARGCCGACQLFAHACLDGNSDKGICRYGSRTPYVMSPGDRVRIAWRDDPPCEHFDPITFGQDAKPRPPVVRTAENARSLISTMVSQCDMQDVFSLHATASKLVKIGRPAVAPLIDALQHEYCGVRLQANLILQEITGVKTDFDPHEPSSGKSRRAIGQYQGWLRGK